MPPSVPLDPAAIAPLAAVEQWLTQVVIGLNLCPFAAEPHHLGHIRLHLSQATTLEALLGELQIELKRLQQTPSCELETTLLVIPQLLGDFDAYNQFLELADWLLQDFGWEGEYQIASFHPDYCFAQTEPDDPANLTNRSPYPILHLLREASIDQALAHFPHPEQIPERNIRCVRALSSSDRQRLFPYLPPSPR